MGMNIQTETPPSKKFANGKWYPVKGTEMWEAYRGGKRYEGTMADTLVHLEHQERRSHYEYLTKSGRLGRYERERLGRPYPKVWEGCEFCAARPA